MKINLFFKLSLWTLILMVVFAGCKKESANNSNNSGGGSGSGSSGYYGNLAATKTKMYYFSGDSIADGGASSNLASAVFSSQAFVSGGYVSGTSVQGGTVSINGTVLKLVSTGGAYSYTDTTYTISYPPQTWSVTGSGQVPSMSYSNSDPFPVVTAKPQLPDTVYKSSGFTFNLSGVSGYDEVRLFISSGGNTILVTYPSSTIQITVSASQLAPFSTGNISFQLNYSQNNLQSFGGKNYNFQNSVLVFVSGMQLQP